MCIRDRLRSVRSHASSVARTEERYSPNAPRALSRSDEELVSCDTARAARTLVSPSSLRASLDEPSSARVSRAFLARATHRAPRATLEKRRAEHEAVAHRVSIAARATAMVPPKRAPARVAFADPEARASVPGDVEDNATRTDDRSLVRPSPLEEDPTSERFFAETRVSKEFRER